MDKTKILSRAELSRVSARLIQRTHSGKLRWRIIGNGALVHVTMSMDMWAEIMELSDDERFLNEATRRLIDKEKLAHLLRSEVA